MVTSSSRESSRLDALYRYDILDTPPEEKFDRIARLASHCLNAPMALITFIDDDRQWFKSCVGLDLDETAREHSFCDQNLQDDAVMIVEDATTIPRFADNPLVTGPPHIRFYAGAPLITPDGHMLGSLCVLDTVPRAADSVNQTVLNDLADTVVTELELRLANDTLTTRNRQVQSLTQELKAAHETTRSQLRHLLQEELQQTLQAARIHLENVRFQTEEESHTADLLAPVTTALNDAVALTDTLVAHFAPPVANQPLPKTLEWLAQKMKTDHAFSVSVHVHSSSLGRDESLNPLLYRLVRELLFRLVEAPDPTTAQVHLTNCPSHLRLTVANDQNITLSQPLSAPSDELTHLRNRLDALGHPIRLHSGPNVCVTIEVPHPHSTNGSESTNGHAGHGSMSPFLGNASEADSPAPPSSPLDPVPASDSSR